MKKEVRLYNVFFPIWLLIIIPITWVVLLPLNFIVDSIVLFIALKFIIKNDDIKNSYKKSILKVWILGFLADIIGAATLLVSQLGFSNLDNQFIDKLEEVNWNAFDNPYAFIYMLISIIISGVAIFAFNYFLSFNKINLEKMEKVKISLTLAILTAPYTFFIPSEWIY